MVRGGTNSVTGSDEASDIASPIRGQQPTSYFGNMNSLRNQIGGAMNLLAGGDSQGNPQNYYTDFPEIFAPAWQEGFVWKGVYLKLFSKQDSQKLKKELKALKHLGIEFLQTETSVKITENLPSILNPNDSIDASRSSPSGQTLTTLLPLLCTIESSSWVLLGTPILPIRKGLSDDYLYKLSHEVSNLWKNTFLLANTSVKNFKPYLKLDENVPAAQPHTFGNIGASNYTTGSNLNNIFLVLSNVAQTLTPLPKVQTVMIISQEISSSISFLEYPKKGLDPVLIKKALGYADEDIGFDSLMPHRKPVDSSTHDLNFEILKFSRAGWQFQMIIVSSSNELPPTFAVNHRAMDLLSYSQSKRQIEIRGNVLVFSCLQNTNTTISPYFISELTYNSTFIEEGPIVYEVPDSALSKKEQPRSKRGTQFGVHQHRRNPSQLGDMGSFVGKESIFKQSFRYDRVAREEKMVQDHFGSSLGKSLDDVFEILEKTDQIFNFRGLKDLFHKKGLNMRFEWIIYLRLKNPRAKILVGSDILARCIKRTMNDKTSKRLKQFKKTIELAQFQSYSKKKQVDEIVQDKSDFFLEEFFKRSLCIYLNALMKDRQDVLDQVSQNDFEDIFHDLSTDLFLHRMRVLDYARKHLDSKTFELYLSQDTIKTLINLPCLHASSFLDAISYHCSLSINYEILRQVRNDKYIHWISAQGLAIKPSDLNVFYINDAYLTTYERCFLKLIPNLRGSSSSQSIELPLPPSLYKLRKAKRYDNETFQTDCFLRESYELPNIEVLNDWIVALQSSLNCLYTPDSQQNLLIEAYYLQMVLAFFGEADSDNQLSQNIIDQINNLVNNSPLASPELTIIINTWYAILSESKSFSECEQSYTIALLILHKLYGDPRGRGTLAAPWELFITWRLSILARLQGRTHDAEYSEELFDASLLSLRENPVNIHCKSHYIYSEPFKAFQQNSPGSPSPQVDLSYLSKQNPLRKTSISNHPFSHWTNHLIYDENSVKIDTLNATLQKSPQLLKWIINHMPIFQPTGILWDTSSLREFFLTIMQSSFTNTTSVSSVSNFSMKVDRSFIGLDVSQGIRSSASGQRSDKKERKFNPGGNLVQIFEKDPSTFNKREISGTIYAWGQNDKGQTGTFVGNAEDLSSSFKKKTRIYFPKRLVLLKDTIIVSISCGHSHSIATTLDGQLLAWGDNSFSQLGLGPNVPQEISTPTIISGIKDVISVSCGHEHTVALTKTGVVYSWGNGEEGLLGHGDTKMQNTPKKIDSLRDLDIRTVVCGGLHTLALTRNGHIYSWGKAEGGQLGLPLDQLVHNAKQNQLYCTAPRRIKGALENKVVVQVACGDAHSLALTRDGLVFGWGYSYYGQLGTGITSESPDPGVSLQVLEPVLVDKLMNVNITDIYAGATFSLFLSDKKELYGCGLNESNQLGIEKNVTKVTTQLERFNSMATRSLDSAFPKKLDCFTSMPVLQVTCGEAHSLALVVCDSSYILFSWGMQKQGQLGLGDVQYSNSTPRPISFLQYVMAYSMACGSYHSMVVLGEPTKAFKKEALVERLEKKSETKWSAIYYEQKESYEAMIETVNNNLDNIIPSEEGKIGKTKAIKKGIAS